LNTGSFFGKTNPTRFETWEKPMRIAADETKPLMIGLAINRIIVPQFSKPIINWITPTIKASTKA